VDGLSSELVARFERDGFVVVPDLLAPEELDELGPLVDAAVAERTRGNRRTLAEKSAYEQSFLQCINLWEDHPELRRLTFHPRITGAAAELLGAPALRLWHDQALYKEAGGRGTEPHQDHPYWPIAETDAVTAWIPFDAVTLETGAMGYLPGSHRVGLRRFANIFMGSTSELLERPEIRGIEPVFVELARGAVAFHHGLTVHLAHPNRSPRTRRVHTAIYFRDGSTRAQQGVHQSVDRAGIAPGAAIASDATPVAWPRAGGVPPTPSSPIPEGSIGRHLWPRIPGRDAPAPSRSGA
jgi:ectoine hydroxylase-related dioxygenase (phytanoyl-CoA dioxygenase family)